MLQLFTRRPIRLHARTLMLLHVERDHKDYQGRGAQDGHLYFHCSRELGIMARVVVTNIHPQELCSPRSKTSFHYYSLTNKSANT